MNKINKISVLSLFSGAGGLDIGFHKTGFNIKACIEIDSDACKTIELNKPKYTSNNTKIYCNDITTLDPLLVQEEIGTVDFIIGGPPCQSFSAAGRRAGGVYGINDTRGSLFWYYAQFLKTFKPKGFLFENVKGILQANKSKDWEIIQNSFKEAGYNLSYQVIDAADFGVPQHRERVIMVGLLEKNIFQFPRPVYGKNSINDKPYITPQIAFSDIDDPNEIVPVYSGKYGHLLNDIPPGLNYSFYTERMGHPKPLFAWRSQFSGFLYKLDPNEPSKTLVAHQGKYDGPFHWKNRKLNIDELIRLQGFPKDYSFYGSKISIEKQIGNSVAPMLGDYLAKAVAKQLFNAKIDIDLLEEGEILKRKKKSRVNIIASNNPISKEYPGQLTLFKNEIDWPLDSTSFHLHNESFKNKCVLKNGTWTIKLEKNNKSNDIELIIELMFNSPLNNKFKKIKCFLHTDTLFDFNIAWDFIHKIIEYSCSYEDLRPLYGHFTEPYPKFTTSLTTNQPNNSLSKFLVKITDYSFLSRIHNYKILREIFGEKVNILDLVKKLRNNGIDIRINETNRTIPKENFQVCYPFSNPSWQQTYTKWIDAGKHKTSDINMSKIMGSEYEHNS